jgi:hypothetical protein
MSRILISIIALVQLVSSGACSRTVSDNEEKANAPADEKVAVIEFDRTEYFMGKVIEGEKVGCEFTFHNTGTADLVIQSASASCGCTVPSWDKEPVKPGTSASLEVIFDSRGRMGVQKKTVTVYSNASEPVSMLTITAEVAGK